MADHDLDPLFRDPCSALEYNTAETIAGVGTMTYESFIVHTYGTNKHITCVDYNIISSCTI